MASSEEEIYSTMFSSLKHPVRRKILRMLSDKPMTFMEMVDHLGVSSSHLTYHLESLGELISKMEDGRYRLSSFGVATVTAMKGVEESPVVEAKRGLKLSFKWKAVICSFADCHNRFSILRCSRNLCFKPTGFTAGGKRAVAFLGCRHKQSRQFTSECSAD